MDLLSKNITSRINPFKWNFDFLCYQIPSSCAFSCFMETLNFHNLKLSLPLVKYFIRFTLLSFLFFLSEKETWKTESETMKEEKRKLEDQIQQDAIKVKEYNVSKAVLKSIHDISQREIA